MILLLPQSVLAVKGLLGTHHTTEPTSRVMIESSVYRLALGELTALDVFQVTAGKSWLQIVNVWRDFLDVIVK